MRVIRNNTGGQVIKGKKNERLKNILQTIRFYTLDVNVNLIFSRAKFRPVNLCCVTIIPPCHSLLHESIHALLQDHQHRRAHRLR